MVRVRCNFYMDNGLTISGESTFDTVEEFEASKDQKTEHFKDVWFNNIKLLCDELGYASNMKEYKENPDMFKGNVADVSTVLRVVLTTKSMTPDLYEIMRILGKDRVSKRFNMFGNN